MPTKRLPPKPHLDELKRQAQDLLTRARAGDPPACQRLREFHPKFSGTADGDIAAASLTWSDGLFAIAREYGFASWPRLRAHVQGSSPQSGPKSFRERIEDPILAEALDRLDDGDEAGLERLLDLHPDLLSRRARFEGENYFRSPSLLAFIAENPIRNDCLPPNIVSIARLLLDRGARFNRADLDETLELLASGRVAREAGVQQELIALLCAHGADPDKAMTAALAHGEFGAARTLLGCGARATLPAAAALGDLEGAEARLAGAHAAERHLALALAARHGHDAIVQLLLAAGEDPNRYNPLGAHSHSTPLHQAAFYGHEAVVQRLLEQGADRTLRDTLWNGTSLDWARHAGQASVIRRLEE